METKIKILVVVLILASSVLIASYLYTNKSQPEKESNVSVEQQKDLPTPNEQEKKSILEKGQFADELIEKYAVDTQTLVIGKDCQMDPLVIRFKGDSVLTIENKDSQMHTIAFENQNFFTVSPNDKREINVNKTFNITEGKLTYKCTDLSQEENVGVMYITAQ